MKVNEFVNNNNLIEVFDKLKKELFYETSHISNIDEVKKVDSYKEILSYDVDILPIIMNEINNNGSYILCFMVFDIVGRKSIDIPESDRGYVNKIKEHIKNWWIENKHKYGE
jgi:hypothetical protein